MHITNHGKYVVALCLALISSSCAYGETPAEFYKGKNIRLFISHPAGGGYDTYARLLARHFSTFLDGHPNIIPQNMPGAAGVVMANNMGAQQTNDGTMIGLGPGSIAVADLFKLPNVRYSAQQLSWIGSMNADVGVTISWMTSEVKSTADLFKKELITGGSGATDNSVRFPTALNNILGTKFKVIPGYAGSSALTLALERGETAGIGGINYSSIVANKPDWLTDKKINILLQISLRGHPDLRDVPTVLDMAKDDEQRQVLELIFSQTEMARVVFGPPGMPEDRLLAMQSAFDRMIKDKGFLADAERAQIEINNPMSGDEVRKLVARLQLSKPAIVKRAAEAISEQ